MSAIVVRLLRRRCRPTTWWIRINRVHARGAVGAAVLGVDGADLGDRRGHLRRALDSGRLGGQVFAVSGSGGSQHPAQPLHTELGAIVGDEVPAATPDTARGWYADGRIRLNAPLKPALSLDCGRLIVVAAHPAVYPVFPATGGDTGPPDVERHDGAGAGRRPGRPHGRRPQHLPLLGRILGGDGARRGVLLSYLLFDGAFIDAAIGLGRRDAQLLLAEGDRAS